MNQFGDAYGQPGESVDSLSSIADELDGNTPESEETLPDIDSEESEEGEVEEAEAEEAEEEAEESDQEDEEVTLKHEGKDVRLKKSEVIELAQKGFDYTQKTMAVAEERKVIQAERAKVEEVRTQHEHVLTETENRLHAFVQFMETKVGAPPPISLAHENASQYLALKEAHEHQKGQLHQAYEAIQNIQEERDRQRHTRIMERAEATEAALRDTQPGWNDDTLQTLAKYADGLGLNPQTVAEAFVEKGFWEALIKAKAYDELQARKATLKPKAELPKVMRPKATNQTPRGIVARQEAEKAYAKRPTLDGLAAFID